jgi:acetyl-CoA acetyltransferase
LAPKRPAFSNQTAIVGIGQTEFSSNSRRSVSRLALEATMAAIDDSGIPRTEIDGLVRYGVNQEQASEAWMAANLGLDDLSFWCSVDYGGSANSALIAHAAAAVHSGLAKYVLCYRALNGRSGPRPGTSDTYDRMTRGADLNYDNFLVPYGMTAPVQFYAVAAQRHMHEFGTTSADLAEIAVTCRANANVNPLAQMHGRSLTLEDHQNSPLISDPLRLFDCCLQTDGAVAVIVTTAERAADLRRPPVVIAGATQASGTHVQGPLWSQICRADITSSAARSAAQRLWNQSGLTPADVDVAQIYDCFTITALTLLEDYGFCKKGEGGPFVSAGHIRSDGSIPINTDGGHLSGGYIHGMTHIAEAVRQLRGESTQQVPGAQVCLVTGGMPAPTSGLLLTAGAA